MRSKGSHGTGSFATVEMLYCEGDQLTWTNLKPRFQLQFATQSDDKLIIDGLSNLAMKPNKSTGELLARITNTKVIIKESYAACKNKIKAPHHNANGGYLDKTATKWKNHSVNNVMQFFKMQLLRAALPRDICKVVAQHDQNSITLDDMYQVATTTQREGSSKLAKTIAVVDDDESNPDTEDDEEEAAAFQNQWNTRFPNKTKKTNTMQPRNKRFQTCSGNNSNRNGKY
jgi:hypothetical protein